MGPGQAFLEALRSGEHALVMGVLNVTPDSFSDGGRLEEPAAAAEAAWAMAAAGAAIVDVGGESTRPGARPVDIEEELRRVLPVVQALGDLPLSIDTRRAAVARRALESGAVLVNDVRAGADPEMFPVVAAHGAGIVCMHMRGTPDSMQEAPRYRDVVGEVEGFLLSRAAAAEEAGIPRDRILIDPGIGFGKTLEHNLALLRALPRLAGAGYRVLVGLSRKSLLGRLTGRDVGARGPASLAAAALAVRHGAAVVRVHDVAETRDAVLVAEAWRGR